MTIELSFELRFLGTVQVLVPGVSDLSSFFGDKGARKRSETSGTNTTTRAVPKNTAPHRKSKMETSFLVLFLF